MWKDTCQYIAITVLVSPLLALYQLVGIAKLPASWHCNSWPRALLASRCITSFPGALLASWCSTSLLGALLASWCSTSLLGEPPGKLALYQLFGIAKLPTSWHCTSWPGETQQWCSIYIGTPTGTCHRYPGTRLKWLPRVRAQVQVLPMHDFCEGVPGCKVTSLALNQEFRIL
jgi:hypothetical protein